MLRLTLQTPGKKILKDLEVSEMTAPGVKGALGIFPDHANFVTELETGILSWRAPNATETESAIVSWGFMQIKDGHVTVLADVSELYKDIDAGRAKVALEKASKKLEDGGLDDEEFRKWELKLKRAMARTQNL